MITKNGNNYEFTVNCVPVELICENDLYILKMQEQNIEFSNLKSLHVFVNSLTDVVENIDNLVNPKYGV